MYSIGQTQVASTPPAIQPAVIAVKGFLLFFPIFIFSLSSLSRSFLPANYRDTVVGLFRPCTPSHNERIYRWGP